MAWTLLHRYRGIDQPTAFTTEHAQAFQNGIDEALNEINRRTEVQRLHVRRALAYYTGALAVFLDNCGQWADGRVGIPRF